MKKIIALIKARSGFAKVFVRLDLKSPPPPHIIHVFFGYFHLPSRKLNQQNSNPKKAMIFAKLPRPGLSKQFRWFLTPKKMEGFDFQNKAFVQKI